MDTWFSDKEILMAHGAGGKASRKLMDGLISPILSSHGSPPTLEDSFNITNSEIFITTDSFVVNPSVFPGGTLGELAVNGTLNDLSVSGARPEVLTLALIIEAGTESKELQLQLEKIASASESAGVRVVAGDTKVVEHGSGDGVFVTTTGIGTRHPKALLSSHRVRPGDKVLVSGTLGDHGVTILMARGDLDFSSEYLSSDTANLWPLVDVLVSEFGDGVRWMRDPTRGGLASTLNELAFDVKAEIGIDEAAVPVSDAVRGACEILGLDPFHIANEGKLVAVLDPKIAQDALSLVREHRLGERAALIGEIKESPLPVVVCRTQFGAHRTLDMLTGDPLPRIC